MSIGKRKVGKKRGNRRDNRNKPQTIVPRGTKHRRKCSTWNNLKPQSGTADVPRGTIPRNNPENVRELFVKTLIALKAFIGKGAVRNPV